MSGAPSNPGVPSGWTGYLTPDIVDQNNNFGSPGMAFPVPVHASPDGGTWAGLFAVNDY